jgi:F0F1-type ATP synthase delta subunit
MSVVLNPQIQTPEQLNDVVIELREFLNKVHDRDVRKRVAKVADEAMPSISPLARSIFDANKTPADAAALKKLITELEEARIVAPRMRVMLSAWPDESVRTRLAEHVRKHIHPLVMLSFTVRADMGGGCILQFGSRRFDFSFRAQLLENKHKISEHLNKYAKA